MQKDSRFRCIYIYIYLRDIGPLTLTDINGDSVLIGVVQGPGDFDDKIGEIRGPGNWDNKGKRANSGYCHGSVAFGRVSNPITLNWINEQIKKL